MMKARKTIAVSVIIGTFIVQCIMCSILTQTQYAVLPSRFEVQKNDQEDDRNKKGKKKR